MSVFFFAEVRGKADYGSFDVVFPFYFIFYFLFFFEPGRE